jgi:hypothetical protein
MADRFEAEVKISIVTAQIMAEEAHQARILDLNNKRRNQSSPLPPHLLPLCIRCH